MVKLTPELIEHAVQYTNALRDRELDLRGYKMPAIENLGSTLDQFDTIDFTDNEIRRLDGFPLLNRLKNLILTDNKIMRIGVDISESLPNLETIILTANVISELKDIDPLAYCQKLTFLSLQHNPVTLKVNYRHYVIGRIPSLRFLDYRRITLSERKHAKSFMKHAYVEKKDNLDNNVNNENSEAVQVKITNGKPKESVDMDTEQTNLLYPKSGGASSQDVLAIQEAIKKAKTLAEVERLQHLLSSGQFVGFANKISVQNKA